MHRRDRRHTEKKGRESQNDIKKLRRENEQLRHEIWSLRDEYDKLEEILKAQKNRDDSEDYEDRSEAEDKEDAEEAEDCSDYTDEEEEEDECHAKEKDSSGADESNADNETNQEERLENAENQKISSEKMSSSGHRLHVEFDDLSVVDEEEEIKKDREQKDSTSLEEKGSVKQPKEADLLRMKSLNGYQCFPRYSSPVSSGPPSSHFRDRLLEYPSSGRSEFGQTLPFEVSTLLPTQRPILYDDSFPPIGSYEQLGIANLPPGYDQKRGHDRAPYANPVGWQSNVYAQSIGFQTSGNCASDALATQQSIVSPPLMFQPPDQMDPATRSINSSRAASSIRGRPVAEETDSCPRLTDNAAVPSLSRRRNFLQRQLAQFHGESIISRVQGSSESRSTTPAELLSHNGWSFGNSRSGRSARETGIDREQIGCNEIRENLVGLDEHRELGDLFGYVDDRPKHFFAPLSAKIQHVSADSGDKAVPGTANLVDAAASGYFENFGTGKSSSSDKTNSTIISTRHFQTHSQLPPTLLEFIGDKNEKGPADICVNGGVAAFVNGFPGLGINEGLSNTSSDDLLVGDRRHSGGNNSSASKHGSNNPLVKSVSCQDLSSEQMQNSLFEMARTFQADGKCQKLTKSDNTLDNPASKASKPFRSQLNVTLRFPGYNCGAGSTSGSKQPGRNTPETPEIPKLPAIDYRLLNNPFIKSFDRKSGLYGNNNIRGPLGRLLANEASESSSECDKMLQHQASTIDYSSALLTQSFARRLNPDENTIKGTRSYETSSEIESDRHGGLMSAKTTCQVGSIDPRIIGTPGKQRQDYQVTSFEAPNPRSLHTGMGAYEVDPMRLLTGSSATDPLVSNPPKLYRNVPFVPGSPALYCSGSQNALRMFYDNQKHKVPAQTQTSIEDDSTTPVNETTSSRPLLKNVQIPEADNHSSTESPTSTQRKRVLRKERPTQKTSKRPLSPAAQRRRLRKQSSSDITADSRLVEDNKTLNKSRQLGSSKTNTMTTTGSENTEDKNESRSSSSGQESPRKEANRRISTYFNTKKRASLGSVKTTRSFSVDNARDNIGNRHHGETVETTNSERERTNSASSREAVTSKARKSSVSSGKVPWCACWGNGCV
ncbi:uncharacterized protein [Venturia canescens]|uniref:uncharacterized protein isoform X2 n=1 Tax=Venturia canescens TaxID=32260 RepID=UPI001C9BD7FA|nr:uncharacterized protein LOC122405986 isoform X2 [Venturia canescens]